jgi:hypothetical protein
MELLLTKPAVRRASVERSDGAGGARTRGLERATLALSQLSYGPRVTQCSAEFVCLGPVDSFLLVVPGWRDPKLDGPMLVARSDN